MPSVSPAQARLMAGVAHNPAFAKKVGIPMGVGQDFNQADKGTGILRGSRPKNPNKIRVPVRVKVARVGVKKVQVKAPHVSYKDKSPLTETLGLFEPPSHPLFGRV